MGQYCCFVSATTNASGDTEDTFLDLTPAAGRVIKIKRIRISINTASDDSRYRVKVIRKSAQGAGSVAGTIVKKDPLNSPTAATTAQVKNGTSAFAAGTAVDTIYDANFNGRSTWECVARDDEDYIDSNTAQIVSINLLCSATSKVAHVMAEWRE